MPAVGDVDPAVRLVEPADHLPQEGHRPYSPVEALAQRVMPLNQLLALLDRVPVLDDERIEPGKPVVATLTGLPRHRDHRLARAGVYDGHRSGDIALPPFRVRYQQRLV